MIIDPNLYLDVAKASEDSSAKFTIKLMIGNPFYGLIVNDKEVKFREDSSQYDMLKLILKNRTNKKKTWKYSEFVSHFGYERYTPKKVNETLYKICWDINVKIKNNTGLEDFLILTNLTVKVNSLLGLA